MISAELEVKNTLNIHDIWSKRLIAQFLQYNFNEILEVNELLYQLYKSQKLYAINYMKKFKQIVTTKDELYLLLYAYYNENRIDEIDDVYYINYYLTMIQIIDIILENKYIVEGDKIIQNHSIVENDICSVLCDIKLLNKKTLIKSGYLNK